MTREEMDTLLQELTTEDITTDRQLEIFSALQSDKDKSISDYQALVDKTSKLQADYDSLKKKSVEDFFKVGKEFTPQNTQTTETGSEEKVKSYDEIVNELLERK